MQHGHKKHASHGAHALEARKTVNYSKRAYRFDSEFCIAAIAENFELPKCKRYANISTTGIAFDDEMVFQAEHLNEGVILLIDCYIHGRFEVPSLYVRRHYNGLAVFEYLDPPELFVKAVQDYSDEMLLEYGFDYLERLKTSEKERMIVDVIKGII